MNTLQIPETTDTNLISRDDLINIVENVLEQSILTEEHKDKVRLTVLTMKSGCFGEYGPSNNGCPLTQAGIFDSVSQDDNTIYPIHYQRSFWIPFDKSMNIMFGDQSTRRFEVID